MKTKKKKRNSKLEQFALKALSIMEFDKNWNSDTVTTIENAAIRLGLSTSDDGGYFKRLPAGKKATKSTTNAKRNTSD